MLLDEWYGILGKHVSKSMVTRNLLGLKTVKIVCSTEYIQERQILDLEGLFGFPSSDSCFLSPLFETGLTLCGKHGMKDTKAL